MSTNNLNVVQLAKRVYGQLNSDNLPIDDLHITKDIPFSTVGKVGDRYVEAVVLGSEVGITYAGNASDVFNINPAIAGAVRQAEIQPYISVLRSVVPWQTISRTQGNESAFVSATKYIVKNNMISHKRFLEIAKIHGQNTTKLLGRISYATATYRGVSLTAGAGTFATNGFGSSITFATGGVDTTNKYILMQPGDFASGIWVGMQYVKVKQLLASDLSVVAEGRLVAYDSGNGILKVDFTPVAASSAGSHILAFDGMELSNEMPGIKKICKNTGSLFNINAGTYPLWKANTVSLAAVKLTLARLESAVADAINAGGISGDLTVYVNPRTFHVMISDEMSKRQYDYSYDKKEIVSGGKAIRFAYADGDMIVKGHRYVMEGDALILRLDDWLNSGSQDIQMSVEGMPEEKLMFLLESQGGYVFNTYSDQYILCRAPAKQILIEGINDESAS